jgi:hypothetical protein
MQQHQPALYRFTRALNKIIFVMERPLASFNVGCNVKPTHPRHYELENNTWCITDFRSSKGNGIHNI